MTATSGWREIECRDDVAGFVISRNPLILWGPSADEYPLALASTVGASIGHRRAYFLISPSWHREDMKSVEADGALVREAQSRFPEHRFLFLVGNRKELENYRRAGIPAAVCNHNMFVDESLFDIRPGTPKRFDAIYNAAIAPYKRHELCTEIASLGLLYYRHAHFRVADADHVRRIETLLRHATFINELDGEYRQLAVAEVPAWLNQARIGLCLSAYEGSMRAASEYLYCGLGVVTTPHAGSRGRLFDPDHVIVAEPAPASIADAVRALIARRLDPAEIRRAALARIQPDRDRLVRIIAEIYAAERVPFPRADWLQLFRRGTWPFKSEQALFSDTPIAEIPAP